MTPTTPALTEEWIARAELRAAARAHRFRSQGAWSEGPVDLLGLAAQRAGETTALVCSDGTTQTYRELDETVSRAASRLLESGAEPGDRVLLVVSNDFPSVVAVHAVIRAGMRALLTLSSAGWSHIGEIVDDTQPDAAFAPASWIGSACPDRGTWSPLSALLEESAPSELPGFARPPDEASVVIFTSGTTSRPKGVVHSLNTLAASARNFAEGAGLIKDDRLFVVSPLGSITGVLQALVVPPLIGGTAVLVEKWDADSAYDLLRSTACTFFGGPDTLLDKILDVAESRSERQVPIRTVYVGGAMLNRRILERAERDFEIRVLRSYGSSEAPVSVTSRVHESAAVRLADEGTPLGHTTLRIGSQNDPAECCLGGPNVFLGYVHEDQDPFDDDWFPMGDLAEFSHGRLRISGRIKDIVIRNGMNVPMAEVEDLVTDIAGVTDAACFPVEDATTGERLAVAVRADGSTAIDLAAIVDALLGAGLAKWKLPEQMVLWEDDFPRTATGKVQRTSLAAMSATRPEILAERLRSR